MTQEPHPKDSDIDAMLYSDDAVSNKRNIVMDMIGAILEAPRKESSADLWKLHIDACLDQLDEVVYKPALNSLISERVREARIDELQTLDGRREYPVRNHGIIKDTAGVEKTLIETRTDTWENTIKLRISELEKRG